MTTYRNKFYQKNNIYSREFFETNEKPTEYKGYLIYHYWIEMFHIVKDGVCVGMYAGINGAKRAIDKSNI